MTVKQFRKRQEARGESMFKLMFKLMKEDMARRANKKRRGHQLGGIAAGLVEPQPVGRIEISAGPAV